MTKPTELQTLSTPAPEDILDSVVDVSDTTQNQDGSSKQFKLWRAGMVVRGGFYTHGNLVTTPITLQNTPAKILGTTTPSQHNLNVSMPSNNSLQYNNSFGESIIVEVNAWAKAYRATGTGWLDVFLHVYKNDSPIVNGELKSQFVVHQNNGLFGTNINGFTTINNGDDLSLWVENIENNSDLLVVEFGINIRT